MSNDSSNKNLPFRPGVGMMILNDEGKIFVGKRIDTKGLNWQMPQGGIDLGETPSAAALREMEEELGSKKGRIIAESRRWYSYRIPDYLINKLWNGQYCGQTQKWFLIKFSGADADINIKTATPEFAQWCWIEPSKLIRSVVPFKKKLYSRVISEFKNFL